ncbi:MAG: thioredoxin family protein [Calditrichia bacterium]
MIIKILGANCSRCRRLENRVRQLLEKNALQAEVRKVDDFREMIKYGAMMIPGLVINEKLVWTGSVPSDERILKWLKEN